MKCVLMIVLVSIISCQSSNEQTKSSTVNLPTTTKLFPLPPLRIRTSFLESQNEDYYKDEDEEGEQVHYPQQTQSYQALPTTTLSRIIETKYGKLQGLSLTPLPSSNHHNNKNVPPIRNKNVEVFLSVPYASPPIKSYRFSPTQTPIPWDGVRTVAKPGFVCPQVMPEFRDESVALKDMPRGYLDYLRRVEPYLRNQSEDCLYLNIFSPAPTTTTTNQQQYPSSASSTSYSSQDSKYKLKPVLIFIHGGKFSWGSGNLYDGTLLAAYADIVFVTLNYRLGVLGFLNVNPSPSTKPRVANYGLMDQIAALHWIKENIIYFGGDPENITMMGYEAGAACIHFLMSSPAVVPGLFHRAILIAGSSKAPWAIVDDPAAVANALAESLNCSTDSSGGLNTNNSTLNSTLFSPGGRERDSASFSRQAVSDPLLDCLKNKHFSYFAKYTPPKFSVDFGPSIDGVVILPNFWMDSEPQVGKRDVSRKYDLLFGISSLEMLTSFSESDLMSGIESSRRDAILRTLIRNSYKFHLNEILATISNEYVDWDKGIQHPISARDLTLNAVTDSLSLAPIIAASESSQIRKSFFYIFEHSTKDGLYSFQKSGGIGGEELNYFFGYPLMEIFVPFFPSPLPSNYTKSEVAFSEMLLTYLSNFVHDGDPNEPRESELVWPISKEKNKFKNVIWEPYDRLHQKYLELTANKIRIRSHYRAHQMAIWLRLIPELQRSGAQYVSSLHNRMNGGYDPSLYIGSFKLPEELEAANEIHHYPENFDFGDFYFNGSGIPPPPPTTCFSPLSSITSEFTKGNVGASVTRSLEDKINNKTGIQYSFISAYTNNLPLTAAVGCSLLILNIFVFALLYYHHQRRGCVRESELLAGNGNAESQTLNTYGEPPELLKSNSTSATLFNQSQSIYSYDDDDENDYYRQQQCENVNFATFSNDERRREVLIPSTQEPQRLASASKSSYCPTINTTTTTTSYGNEELTFSHDKVHFSHHSQQQQPLPSQPSTSTINNKVIRQMIHQSNLYQPHEEQQQLPQQNHLEPFDHVCLNLGGESSSSRACCSAEAQSQLFGIPSLPLPLLLEQDNSELELEQQQQSDSSSPSNSTIVTALPKKPFPPTRNLSNYTITQRQLFSVIMTLLTFGIF